MIITCNSCQKKFEVDDNLIPNNGRMLVCSSCDYQWFFKKEVVLSSNTKKEFISNKSTKIDKKELFIQENNSLKTTEDIDKTVIKKKKINFLSLILVFIITLISLILIIDTFKSPLNTIVPNVEFLLYNLYETIEDIFLFIKDLL